MLTRRFYKKGQPSRFNWQLSADVPDLPTQPYPIVDLQDEQEYIPPAFSIRGTMLTFTIAAVLCAIAVVLWLLCINPLLVPPQYTQAPTTSLDVGKDAFVAEVFNGRVVVTDTPIDHPEKESIFLCQAASNDQTVQLQRADVNHDGAQDVIVYTQNGSDGIVLYARGNSFVEEK